MWLPSLKRQLPFPKESKTEAKHYLPTTHGKERGIKIGVHGPSKRDGGPVKPRFWIQILKNYLKSKGELKKKQPSEDLGPTSNHLNP